MEKACNPEAEEGEWIAKLDVVQEPGCGKLRVACRACAPRQRLRRRRWHLTAVRAHMRSGTLKLVKQASFGKCQRECRCRARPPQHWSVTDAPGSRSRPRRLAAQSRAHVSASRTVKRWRSERWCSAASPAGCAPPLSRAPVARVLVLSTCHVTRHATAPHWAPQHALFAEASLSAGAPSPLAPWPSASPVLLFLRACRRRRRRTLRSGYTNSSAESTANTRARGRQARVRPPPCRRRPRPCSQLG